jgi:hypothetical protein
MKRAAPLLVVAAVLLSVPSALAHGERTVAGVDWSVGWANEPPFAGQPNAIEITLERDGEPITGAEQDLQVTLTKGAETSTPVDPGAAPGSPGTYYAEVIPGEAGEYSITVTGTVDGEDVEETFEGANDGIENVRAAGLASFPEQADGTDDDEGDDDGDDMLPTYLAVIALIVSLIALAMSLRGRRTTT